MIATTRQWCLSEPLATAAIVLRSRTSDVTSSISPTIKTATIGVLRHSLPTFQSQFLFRLEWTSPPPVRRALGFPHRVSCTQTTHTRPFFGVSSKVFSADHCSRVVTVLSGTLGVDRERICHLMRLGMTVVKECLGHSRKCGRLAVVSFRVSKAFSK